MMFKQRIRLIPAMLLLLAALLAGCGESNPYLGTWDAKLAADNPLMQMGMGMANMMGGQKNPLMDDFTMIFTEKELISINAGKEERHAAIYKKENGSYSISIDNGTTWMRGAFKDKDNMIFTLNYLGGININLKRVK